MNHLTIIGAGSVGTAIAFTALNRGLASHLSLYDLNGAKAHAEALDLRHGLQFLRPATIEGGDDLAICRDASVVVVTAGAKQRPGETRLDLTARNADLLRQLLPEVTRVAPKALLLIVTNPVDVLTQLAIQITGRIDGTVLGSGTFSTPPAFVTSSPSVIRSPNAMSMLMWWVNTETARPSSGRRPPLVAFPSPRCRGAMGRC